VKEGKQFNYLKKCRYGWMLYNINDIYVGRALHFYGEYSQGEVEVFNKLLKPGYLVVEVGAHIGAHTVYFAKKVGNNGLVIAFEPQRLLFQTLCANVALNSLVNVVCEKKCVGSHEGVVLVPFLDPWVPNNFGGLELDRKYQRGEYVEMISLDTMKLPRCDFMKVDVEGMELEVLKGAVETIRKHKPILFVEDDREEKVSSLVAFIKNLGYKIYQQESSLYNDDNFFRNSVNIYPGNVTKNLVCIHKDYNSHYELRLPSVE